MARGLLRRHGDHTDDRGLRQHVTAEILWEGTHTGDLETPTETVSPTGRQISVRAVQVCTVEEGQITQVSHYFDMVTLLKQIGAFPEPVAV